MAETNFRNKTNFLVTLTQGISSWQRFKKPQMQYAIFQASVVQKINYYPVDKY